MTSDHMSEECETIFICFTLKSDYYLTKFRYSRRDEKKSNTPSICTWLQNFLVAVYLIFYQINPVWSCFPLFGKLHVDDKGYNMTRYSRENKLV